MQIALSFFLLGILVTFHELGHFLAGRRVGVYIQEFAIGFGPILFSRRTQETRYSLRLIPLGGFCKFAGEDGGVESDDLIIPKSRLLLSQSPLDRAFIMVSGPLANLLVAAFAFCIVFAFIGINQPTTTILETVEAYPAEKAGLRPGDTILEIEGQEILSWDHMVTLIQPLKEVPITIVVERDGVEIDSEVTPIEVDGVGMLGVRPKVQKVRQGFLKGVFEGIKETLMVSFMWIKGILGMLLGKIAAEVAGPLGITQILGQAAGMGLGELIYLTGALSANLALMNLLPIPALDGSRLMFIGFEAIRGKPIDPEKEGFAHLLGFFLLMTVFALVTYRDIVKLIKG